MTNQMATTFAIAAMFVFGLVTGNVMTKVFSASAATPGEPMPLTCAGEWPPRLWAMNVR